MAIPRKMIAKWESRFELKPNKWVFVPTAETIAVGRKIKKSIKECWKPPSYYYHLRSGGHVSALKSHLKHAAFLHLDVQDFFGSINKTRVTRCLKSKVGYAIAREWANISTVIDPRDKKKYIIPFGQLRLRMSGPTAGRLIQAEIKQRFASVNLPMLHRRTAQGNLSDEFRPGVELQQENIDLSNEFERQFFGDLMLFSVAELMEQADVNEPFQKAKLVVVVDRKEAELLVLYQHKRESVLEKNRWLNELVFETGHWWLQASTLTDELKHVKTFIDNIEYNFSDQSLAYQQIYSAEHRTERKKQIIEAVLNYRTERDAWDRLF